MASGPAAMSDFLRIEQGRCPHCHHVLTAVGHMANDIPPMPREGDMTVCIGCGAVLQFNARLRLEAMTAAELSALDPEEAADLDRTRRAVLRHLTP